MFEINARLARTWSRMGPRAVYGQALLELGKENAKVFAVSADLGRSSGLDRFSKELPMQYLNTGIAEQNMVCVAAGLARSGYQVFASTFAPFAALRAGDQVRMNLGYMQENVTLVALGSGLAMGFLGNSHFGLEDLAVMRAIPNLTVISPCDCVEMVKSLQALSQVNQPVYLRLTGTVNMPVVHETDYTFTIGRGYWVYSPSTVTVIASGVSVGHAKKAIDSLEDPIGLLNLHTVKPLDYAAIDEAFAAADTIIVAEEHTVIGGLGSMIQAYAREQGYTGKIIVKGIQDEFVTTGSYAYMIESLGLDHAGFARDLVGSLAE